jgi:ATP-dependent Zn protease
MTPLRHIAVHEAGHAVIARVLTLSAGSVTIKPEYARRAGELSSAGHAITDEPNACIYQWARRGKVRDAKNAMWFGRIVAFMAGAEAEIVILGSTMGGDGDDRYQIDLMADEVECDPDQWRRIEARLRAMTQTLVRRHRDKIERVADALLAKKTLSAATIDKLAGRSVNDVKVNAPFLLEMHRRQEIDQLQKAKRK